MVRHAKCFFASALGLFVRATKRKCCSLDSRDKSGLLCWVEAWYHWNWYKSLSPYLGLRRVTSTGRDNLMKVWSCKEDELSLRLTMSWSKRASGTKTRPDVLEPGLECSPNILLPTEVRQLVEMMKILIRLLNKMAPILVATLSGRHGYKMRWHVEQTNGCGERVRCLQICCDERRMACAILLWALLELNERGVKYYSW